MHYSWLAVFILANCTAAFESNVAGTLAVKTLNISFTRYRHTTDFSCVLSALVTIFSYIINRFCFSIS
jgi:hypothetical protein